MPWWELILSAETPREGDLSPVGETRSRWATWPWAHISWAWGREMSSSLPFGEAVHRGRSQYCLLSVCMTATSGNAWLTTFTKSSMEVKLFQHRAYNTKNVSKASPLKENYPPLSFTAPYLVFIVKAFDFRNRDSSHVNAYTKENKYNTHFCRRIYYLADQFKSKKKSVHLWRFFLLLLFASMSIKICLHSGFSFVLPSLLVLKLSVMSSCTTPQSKPANSLRFLLISSSVEKEKPCIHYAGLQNVLWTL